MNIQVIVGEPMVKEAGRKITGPASAMAAAEPLMKQMADEVGRADQEYVFAVPLNTANECGAPILLSMGGQNYAQVDLRILFRRLLSCGAAGFFLVHNHPSGSASFSSEDIDLTKSVKEAAKLLGFAFFDHLLIYSRYDWLSYHEQVGALV